MPAPDDFEDIVIEPDGDIRFVYSDRLAGLFEGEAAETVRASHVEPARQYCTPAVLATFGDGWVADMRPVGGPVLGIAVPFGTRAEALDAERQWIRKELGL